MLSWGGANPQETLQGLLQVVQRLLQPSLGDSASLYVGDLVLQILQKMPAQVSAAFALDLIPLCDDCICDLRDSSTAHVLHQQRVHDCMAKHTHAEGDPGVGASHQGMHASG